MGALDRTFFIGYWLKISAHVGLNLEPTLIELIIKLDFFSSTDSVIFANITLHDLLPVDPKESNYYFKVKQLNFIFFDGITSVIPT